MERISSPACARIVVGVREEVKLAEFERRRIALEEDGQGSAATTKRIRRLERELWRRLFQKAQHEQPSAPQNDLSSATGTSVAQAVACACP